MSANPRAAVPNAARNTAQSNAPSKALADAKFLKTLYQVHWVSAAVSLILLLLFALTGVVMNHPAVFKTEPVIVRTESRLPDTLLPVLVAVANQTQAQSNTTSNESTRAVSADSGRREGAPGAASRSATNRSDAGREQGTVMTLPSAVGAWLTQQFAFEMARAEARLQGDTVRVTRREPGHQIVATFNLHSGVVKHEATDRGWLVYLTDLHKAKSAGDAWRWFVDFFAFGVLVFALSGLWILQRHAPRRRAVWPTVALGVVLPIVVILLFVR